jgi:hypothetical protein
MAFSWTGGWQHVEQCMGCYVDCSKGGKRMLDWKPAENFYRITPEYWTGGEHHFAQEEGGQYT